MKRVSFIFVALVVVAYNLAGRIGIAAHEDPTEMDTVSYLEEALRIRETGGVPAFIPNSLTGAYLQATQHPFYLLLLSGTAEPTLEYFVRAKWVTFQIGLAFLAVLFWVVKRRFGEEAAALTVFMTLLSATFIHMTTMVACESLLALFFILWWGFSIEGFKNQKYFLAAGALAGCVFLTKSIGILLLPIFFIVYVLIEPRTILTRLRNVCVWGYAGMFFLVSSPLLIRNWVVYGTPFYSNSSHVLWIDRWHDYLRPDLLSNPPTLSTYVQSHTFGQMLKTFSDGLWIRDVKMIVDGLKPFPFWQSPFPLNVLRGFYERTIPFQELWAVLLVGLACFALVRLAKGADRVLTLTTSVVFLIFVGWFSKVFPGAPPTRLVYPILFLILIYAARILAHWIRPKVLWPLVISAVVIYSGALFVHYDWTQARKKAAYSVPPVARVQIDWAIRNLKKDDRMLGSAAFINNAFYFKKVIPGELIIWPVFPSMDQAIHYIQKQNIDYAFVDLSTVAYGQLTFGQYYKVGREMGMIRTSNLPNPFREMPLDPRFKTLFELYSFA